jgi:hypothetical protein
MEFKTIADVLQFHGVQEVQIAELAKLAKPAPVTSPEVGIAELKTRIDFAQAQMKAALAEREETLARCDARIAKWKDSIKLLLAQERQLQKLGNRLKDALKPSAPGKTARRTAKK